MTSNHSMSDQEKKTSNRLLMQIKLISKARLRRAKWMIGKSLAAYTRDLERQRHSHDYVPKVRSFQVNYMQPEIFCSKGTKRKERLFAYKLQY
jgi:hypothetical protein